MADSERRYIDLIFSASKKYGSWDPEVCVEVGDWGRITTGKKGLAFWRGNRGIFIKEGNIYKDGKAKEYGIPDPKEFGLDASDGGTWIVSLNAQEIEVGADAAAQTPIPILQCTVKAGFKFSSGVGAILVMFNDTITTIDPPGTLRRLLEVEDMRGCVVVSEVHRCSAYARHLTSDKGETVLLGLGVQPPMPVGSVQGTFEWFRSSKTGNFRAKVNHSGQRDYYPLFRLASLKDTGTSSGVRGSMDEEDAPLPDAVPPWQTEEIN